MTGLKKRRREDTENEDIIKEGDRIGMTTRVGFYIMGTLQGGKKIELLLCRRICTVVQGA